jgi:hypothetical protein
VYILTSAAVFALLPANKPFRPTENASLPMIERRLYSHLQAGTDYKDRRLAKASLVSNECETVADQLKEFA